MKRSSRLSLAVLAVTALASFATPASGSHPAADHRNMDIRFFQQNSEGQTNSDLAFWGNRAFAGDYGGFRIFDISNPTRPVLVTDFRCYGPQNDVSVWDRDGNGQADILFTSIDRTLAGEECGSPPTVAHDDPNGWEGIRIFDISNQRAPVHIGSVYQDCGSHTHTLVPDAGRNRVLLYNSSYPLRPGPTCGPVRGPEAGRHPHHGVIQVVQVRWNASTPLAGVTAAEIAEPPVNYPGDPDNVFNPEHHGFAGFLSLRACHDIAVNVPAGLVGAACAEQAQMWRLNRNTMLPDSANPLWVFDNTTDTDGPGGGDAAADFWHSATFSWDGKTVNFSDESFGWGCPPVTNITDPAASRQGPSDTGRTYFLRAGNGKFLSDFMIDRPEPDAYCSTHQGNVVGMKAKKFLVQAWYMGGVDVIDFTNPRKPTEVAWFDFNPAGATGSDNWAHYWYENRAAKNKAPLITYATDGVHNPATGRGFEVFEVLHKQNKKRVGLDHLNPQTQERRL